jgi:2-amino-4-hydroxy-6-hydroxymethyldihydropteridine diphosphokinase
MAVLVTVAYLGLGSNQGDRLANIGAALRAVGALGGTTVQAVSLVYESEPWGVTDQPPFANAVARVDTRLAAPQLLKATQAIEASLGRPAPEQRVPDGPRPIDIDILLFGSWGMSTDTLNVPHPGLRTRAFVVVPLLEIAPDIETPDGPPVTMEEATEGAVTGVLGVVAGFEQVHDTPGQPRWVAVRELSRMRPDMRPDVGLIFDETVLQSEGIPYLWDPQAPTAGLNPFGVAPEVRLMVPRGYEKRALESLAAAEAAAPEFPDDEPEG